MVIKVTTSERCRKRKARPKFLAARSCGHIVRRRHSAIATRAVINQDGAMHSAIRRAHGKIHSDKKMRRGIQAAYVKGHGCRAREPRNRIPELEKSRRSGCPGAPHEHRRVASADKREVARLIDDCVAGHAKMIRKVERRLISCKSQQ